MLAISIFNNRSQTKTLFFDSIFDTNHYDNLLQFKIHEHMRTNILKLLFYSRAVFALAVGYSPTMLQELFNNSHGSQLWLRRLIIHTFYWYCLSELGFSLPSWNWNFNLSRELLEFTCGDTSKFNVLVLRVKAKHHRSGRAEEFESMKR